MATLEQLQVQLDALNAALASGESRVTYNGKTVEYRDVDQLLKAIAAVEGQIASKSSAPQCRSAVSYFNRGHA